MASNAPATLSRRRVTGRSSSSICPGPTTKALAYIIHQEVGGTLVPLELERPYPDDYNATVQQVVRENETG
jgi:hypothetical protein